MDRKKPNLKKPFQCSQCPESFDTPQGRGRHETLHNSGRKLKCSDCKYECNNARTLEKHCRTHRTSQRRAVPSIDNDTPALRRANAEHETESSDVDEDEYVVESDDDIPAVEHRSSVDMRRESLAEILDLGTSGTPARIGASLFPGKREEQWVDPLPEKLQFQQQESKFAELKCKYSRANAKVRWYKGRKELFSDGLKYKILIDKQSITLIINNPDPDDSGKYTCEANGVPTNSFVTVEGPSIKYVFLTPLPNTMDIYRTKQGVLTCKLNSARAPLVWQRDDEKPIDVDDPRYQIEKDAAGCFTLTIRVVERIDQGMWTATVNKNVISKCQVYVVEDPRDTFVVPEQLRNETAAIEALRRANAEHELRPNDEHETESSDVDEDEYVVESDDDTPAVEVRCADERLLAKAPLNVPGPPGPPKPLHTAYNSITLQWARPLRDGGTPITGYELEKREHGTNAQWEKAAFGSVPDTQFKVTGVKQYHFFEFRVAAVNAVGQGEWSDNSVPIAATRSSCKPLITMGMLARENDLGSDSVDLRLEVVDRPAPPEGSETAGACPTIVINNLIIKRRRQPRKSARKDATDIQCCSNDLTPSRPKNTERTASSSGRRRVGSTAADRPAQAAAAARAGDEEAPNEVDKNEEKRQDMAVVTKRMAILELSTSGTPARSQASVVEEPFVVPLKSQRPTEKENATFECYVNDKEIDVKWFHDGAKIGMDGRHIKQRAGCRRRLLITNVLIEDHGEYKCTTKDDETMAQLIVDPKFIKKAECKPVTWLDDEL
ncbi:hypothetical protein niasHS_005493 [Heterodera schachtii]|uniref:Uncharacterized protein n=1 Tax=Heterodera schachtii TaxID=97005 RepID=A0ABD2JIY4_HETSC